MSISIETALELVVQGVEPLSSESVPLLCAAGRILAQDLHAAIDQPPFPRSPLDGYAVRGADTVGATKETPVTLKVTSKLYAGSYGETPVLPGEATRVMTGAMLPQGADCVIRQEDTDEGEETVRLYREHHTHENYVFAGEDFAKGSVLLKAGTKLDAAALSVAAASGYDCLTVYRQPRVALICTGDELVEPGNPLPPGKIYDSSLVYLSARLNQLGAQICCTTVAGDDLDTICRAVAQGAESADLVLTTGGASVGQRDLVPAALETLGAAVRFHGVAMKPGMPTLHATLGNVPVLGLSGNPFAAAVAFELLARPLLFCMSQDPAMQLHRRSCTLSTPFGKPSRGRRFIRAVACEGSVTLPEGHSSGQMHSMVGCNCLVDVPAGQGALEAGEVVEVVLL